MTAHEITGKSLTIETQTSFYKRENLSRKILLGWKVFS